MRVITREIVDGKYSMEGVALICGADISLVVCGGTKHHIGAAALGVVYSKTDSAKNISASVSLLCVAGHKDDELARQAAYFLSKAHNCTVSINVGIHIDEANSTDIQRLKDNFDRLINDLSKAVSEPS
jgi:hypothetical protein